MRAMLKGRLPTSGFPSNRIDPLRGGVSPKMLLSVVVLPAPLRPSNTVMLPTGTDTETPSRMWNCPMKVSISLTSRTLSGTTTLRLEQIAIQIAQVGALHCLIGGDVGRLPFGE